MKRPANTKNGPAKFLRTVALQYPEAQEGISCAGTSLESRTVKARNKAFLFLSATDARLKLGASIAEATELARKEPDRYTVGTHGWVKIIFGNVKTLLLERLARWLDESYRLLAPKQLAASLPEQGKPNQPAKKTRKAEVTKKSMK